MISATGKNNGFTLIEIMVSIAILSIGLIVILQGFTSSLNTLGVCRNNLEASLFAEERMADLEIDIKQNKYVFTRELSGSEQKGNLGFQWRIAMTPEIQQEELNRVLTTVSWQEGKRKGVNSLDTFLVILHAK